MSYVALLVSLLAVDLFAAMSPGPNFIVVALFMAPEIPAGVKAIAIGIVLFDTVLWYGIVAACFSRSSVQRLYAGLERPLNRLAGTVMMLFAGRLLFVRD